MNEKQLLEAAHSLSCLRWVYDLGMKTEKGDKIEFKNHRFLKDIFDDWTPVQVIRKASQAGFSTMMTVKSIWAAKFKNWNIIYTLPTFGDVSQFVSSKTDSIIGNNPTLNNLIAEKDSVLQKKIGRRFIYYRGTFSAKTEKEKWESAVGTMLSSDLNIHDECDRSDQGMLEQYESRVKNSGYAGRWYFSNPSNPFTVSQSLYEKSDKKQWFIKCQSCNTRQTLDFWKNIVDGQFVCIKCHKLITDEDRRMGEWVKENTLAEISGYQLSHLICPWITAEQIVEDSLKNPQYFYNFILGLPYKGSDVVVDKDVILTCIDTKENDKNNNVIGVDQGLKKHYVIGNKQGIFKVGVTEKWSEIEDLMHIYDIKTAVFDALPDLTEPRKLQKKYLGKIWLNYYKKDIKSTKFIKFDKDTHVSYTDRTKIIQQVIDELVNKQIRFQMDIYDLEEYIRHWGNVYKIVEKDNLGLERDVWETSGDDHLVHATCLWRIGMEKGSQESKTMVWGADDFKDINQAPDPVKTAIMNEFYE